MIIWGKEIFIAAPERVILLLALIPIIICLVYGIIRRQRVLHMLTLSIDLQRLFKNVKSGRYIIKALLILIAAASLCIALMRPQWDKKEKEYQQKGRDFLIALDISRSMLVDDLEPNRLTVAKNKIKRLARYFPTDRFALMLFSESSFLICPFTSDHDSLAMFLDQIDDQMTSATGTSLGAALSDALTLFNKVPDQKNKILVLFTDGEDFSENLSSIKKDAVREKVHIFALGVGTSQGAPVPLIDANGKRSGYIKDEKGAVIISHLDQLLLQRLVEETGGIYISSTRDMSDISLLVNKLNQFEKQALDAIARSTYQDRYIYFAVISLLALLIEWLL